MAKESEIERNIEELKADGWRLPVNAASLAQSSAEPTAVSAAWEKFRKEELPKPGKGAPAEIFASGYLAAQSDAGPVSDPRFVITEVEGVCYVQPAGSDTILAEFTINYDRMRAPETCPHCLWEIEQDEDSSVGATYICRKVMDRPAIQVARICGDSGEIEGYAEDLVRAANSVSVAPPRPDASAGQGHSLIKGPRGGISWGGFYVEGDRKSIGAVRDAFYSKDRCEALDRMIAEKQLVRPDASAGLIEAAKAARLYAAKWPVPEGQYALEMFADTLRARAADRSGRGCSLCNFPPDGPCFLSGCPRPEKRG